MSDSQGPGSHVLYQTFIVTSVVPSAIPSFDLYINNADAFRIPNTLDFATPTLNQQAWVDLLLGTANPFSVAGADVLLNPFRTPPGDPLESGYTHYSVDITALLNAHLNTQLLLRFAEVDNVNFFNLGVDNVSIDAQPSTTPVPEPSTLVMGLSSLLGMGMRLRKR